MPKPIPVEAAQEIKQLLEHAQKIFRENYVDDEDDEIATYLVNETTLDLAQVDVNRALKEIAKYV